MIISVNSGKSGWSEYVISGTKQKPRDQDKIYVLDGNLELGDYLSKNNKYEESYYTFMLGFKGKPSDKEIKEAYEEFKTHMFVGFDEDEYHIDAVVHKDTDDYHIHARVPKQNLLTNTHLQLYYDKVDRKRKELIQDYISLKMGFPIAREEERKLFKSNKEDYINQFRKEYGQTAINLSKKRDRAEAEVKINEYIRDLHQSKIVDSLDDIKSVLESLDLEIVKIGRDIKKDFDYITVQNESGKMRIKGDIYSERFFKYSREDRESQISSNRRIRDNEGSTNERLSSVQRRLSTYNGKRLRRVEELFESSRARARERIQRTLQETRATKSKRAKDCKNSQYEDTKLSDNSSSFSGESRNLCSNESISGYPKEDSNSTKSRCNQFISTKERDSKRQERYDLLGDSKTKIIQAESKDLYQTGELDNVRRDLQRIRRERKAKQETLLRTREERERVYLQVRRNIKHLQESNKLNGAETQTRDKQNDSIKSRSLQKIRLIRERASTNTQNRESEYYRIKELIRRVREKTLSKLDSLKENLKNRVRRFRK